MGVGGRTSRERRKARRAAQRGLDALLQQEVEEQEQEAKYRSLAHDMRAGAAPPKRFTRCRVHGMTQYDITLHEIRDVSPTTLPSYSVVRETQQTYACYSRRPQGRQHVHKVGRAKTMGVKVHG